MAQRKGNRPVAYGAKPKRSGGVKGKKSIPFPNRAKRARTTRIGTGLSGKR